MWLSLIFFVKVKPKRETLLEFLLGALDSVKKLPSCGSCCCLDATHPGEEVLPKDQPQLGQPRLALPEFKVPMENPFDVETLETSVTAVVNLTFNSKFKIEMSV